MNDAPVPADVLDTPIEELALPILAYNVLARAGITDARRLVDMYDEELLNLRGFGQRELDQVQDKLRPLGLSVRT